MGSCKLIGPGVLGVTMVQYISAGNVRPFQLPRRDDPRSRHPLACWTRFRDEHLSIDLKSLDVGADANVAIRTGLLLIRLHCRVLCSLNSSSR